MTQQVNYGVETAIEIEIDRTKDDELYKILNEVGASLTNRFPPWLPPQKKLGIMIYCS